MDYLLFGEIGHPPGISQSGPSIPEMPGPLRPLKDRIAQALNDPNATEEQLRFRRELAESHPEVFKRLMNGEDPGTLASLVVAPSIESKGPSKAAKALRERQEGLARRKLAETQAAAKLVPKQTPPDLSSMGGSPFSSSGPMGEVTPSDYSFGGPLSPDGADLPGDRSHLGPTSFEHGPPLGSGMANRPLAPSSAEKIGALLEASGVDNPGVLQKLAAKLVGATPLGNQVRLAASGAKLGTLGRGAAWLGKSVTKHPVNAALTALMALQMLAPEGLTSPVKGLTGGDSAVDLFLNGTGLAPGQPTFANRLANQGQLTALQDQMRLKAQRDAQTAAQNTALLFQTAPHVAAQIMAGRRLPKGAVVIGGTPRVDLMQEMAMQMGQGQFEQQDPMQSILERQQGGGT